LIDWLRPDKTNSTQVLKFSDLKPAFPAKKFLRVETKEKHHILAGLLVPSQYPRLTYV